MYKFLLKRKIKKLIKKPGRERVFLNMKEINSVMVLFEMEDFEDANYFIKQLKKMGKRIKVFAYKNSKDANSYSKVSYTPVIRKKMKYLSSGSLTQVVDNLISERFDMVVDFTLKENLLLIYILAAANSPLKVGFHNYFPRVHDIIFSDTPDSEQNMRDLGEHLIYYLSVISSKSINP